MVMLSMSQWSRWWCWQCCDGLNGLDVGVKQITMVLMVLSKKSRWSWWWSWQFCDVLDRDVEKFSRCSCWWCRKNFAMLLTVLLAMSQCSMFAMLRCYWLWCLKSCDALDCDVCNVSILLIVMLAFVFLLLEGTTIWCSCKNDFLTTCSNISKTMIVTHIQSCMSLLPLYRSLTGGIVNC